MSCEIIALSVFNKEVKKLSKKYPSLKSDLAELFKNLEENPKLGISLGNNCFKIRLSISSKGKGKSGGGRVITHFVISENIIYLLSIYDKSDKENLTDKEISELLNEIK